MSATSPSRHLSVRPLSLRPSPLRLPFPPLPSSDRSAVLTASALVFQPLPHTGQSSGPFCTRCRSASPPGTPGTVPPGIFLSGLRPSGSRFRRSPAPTVPPSSPLRTFVSQPLPHTGQSSDSFCARCRSASLLGTPGTVPSDIFLPGSCRFSLRPSGSRFRRSPAPAVLPSLPLLPSSSSLSRTPDRVRVRSVRAAVPHHHPAPRERSRPTSFCPAPVASAFAPPAPVSAAPQLRPFRRPHRSVPSSPSRSRTPDKVRVCTVHAAVPHPHPARRERSRPTSFCPAPVASAFAPPAPVSAAPPFSLFPAAAPPLPAATGRTGCSFGPAREKGCLTDLRQPRFIRTAIRELLPIRNFQKIGKTRQTAPFIRTAVRELPPPEHAAQRIEKLAGQLRPLPNRAAGRPPSRPGSGGAQQFIAPQQWIT